MGRGKAPLEGLIPGSLPDGASQGGTPLGDAERIKVTAYFRDVVRQKYPGIKEAWILRVMAEPADTVTSCCTPHATKIRWFEDTDTLYIALSDRVSSSSEAINDNLIVDFDAQGKPVGVTVEHYSQISDSTTNETELPITPALQPA